uniref:Uncharacterized protein n=1 Tax=Anguilla anguilla TaxID=7936 RepID=A0A0E9QPB3_ANGAN
MPAHQLTSSSESNLCPHINSLELTSPQKPHQLASGYGICVLFGTEC